MPSGVRGRLRNLLFEWLDLSWPLPTGVKIRVENYPEWMVYNEIFVSGEYDEALSRALTDAPDTSPMLIVDLGANVGFFTLRAVDRLRREGAGRGAWRIIAVEGHPTRAREFRERVIDANGLASHVTLVHGLVGQRAGTGTLYEPANHGPSATLFSPQRGPGIQVPFVDLATVVGDATTIDLLKCDIEGAELPFLEQYSDVLAKVRVAVFELHRDMVDVDRCVMLLRGYGFTGQAATRAGETFSLLLVWR